MSSVQVQFNWNNFTIVSPRMPHLLRRQISDRLFAVHRHHSTYPADLPSLISNLVLTHPAAAAATAACDDDAASLSLALSSFSLSPSVVDDVLERLWNDGPRALLFFCALLLLPSYSPSPSTFDLAIDIAVRLRNPAPSNSSSPSAFPSPFAPSPSSPSASESPTAPSTSSSPFTVVRLFITEHLARRWTAGRVHGEDAMRAECPDL